MQLSSTELRKAMLDAGVHLGHQRRKWNPKMLPYLYSEHKGIHIIDLNKTQSCLEEAAGVMKQLAKNGKKILFVATKKQAKDIVKQIALELEMPYATERWLGGMITNFVTIRKSIKKMQNIEKLLDDTEVNTLTKKEKLTLERDRNKIGGVLKGISSLNAPPSCVFLVDIKHEHIALAEAKRLGIIVSGMTDTNSDPSSIDFPVPSNDDSTTSIAFVLRYIADAIKEGLEERKHMQEPQVEKKEEEQEQAVSQEKAVVKEEEKAPETKKKKATVTETKTTVSPAKKSEVTKTTAKRPRRVVATKKKDK